MSIILLPIDSVPYSALMREVIPYVPMAPEFDIEYRLKLAARDFCRGSLAWRQQDTELLTTNAAQAVYEAELDAGREIAAVISAWAGGSEVEVELPGERDDVSPGDTSSAWRIGVEPDLNSLRLSPAPSVGGVVVTGTIAFAPNEESTSLPEFIWRRWRNVIAAGAISALKAQANKPWSDPAGALAAGGAFSSGIQEASNRTGPVRRRPLRVTPA